VLIPVLLVCAGFASLYQGGNALLSGASGLARHFGLPPLLVGLTVVAFATSAPELAVSVLAAFQGTPDIAVGNVLGSNIFNTLVAVGIVAVLSPFVIPKTLMRREIPLGIAATMLVGIFAWTDGGLTRMEGTVLGLTLAGVLAWIVRSTMKEMDSAAVPKDSAVDPGGEADLNAVPAVLVMGTGSSAALLDFASLNPLDFAVPGAALLTLLNAHFHVKRPSLLVRGLAILLGLALLVLGSNALVDGAREIALSFGVSQAMVGLTVVAIGTSAPELATAVAAARKGETELALGNALGSNLFNLFAVLGVAAAIFPFKIAPSFLHRDLPVALVVSTLLMLPLLKRNRVGRGGGLAMLGLWVAYTGALIWLELR